jgi:hypothetical protein
MRLTKRDKRILEAIHAFDGMMGFSQIQRMFFTGVSQAKQRMMLLYQHGYVNRPNREQRRRTPEMIYWLDKNGAKVVAAKNSLGLREFKWVEEPRWFQVEHDLAVNDFRLDMQAACEVHKEIALAHWLPEREFWAYPDTIKFTYRGRSTDRKIRPDGYFMLTTPKHNIRYLLEIDRSTEDNPRFFREKIIPGLAYIRSEAYEDRFGYRSGRWLVVTTGERRLANMLRQARRAEAKGLFYFTTYDKVKPETLLTEPIWQRGDRDESVPLVFLD